MKFPNSLRRLGVVFGTCFEQVLRLVLEMIEVRVGWKRFYRHDELPLVSPGPHFAGRKSVRKTGCHDQVDFCPFRGRIRPVRSVDTTTIKSAWACWFHTGDCSFWTAHIR